VLTAQWPPFEVGCSHACRGNRSYRRLEDAAGSFTLRCGPPRDTQKPHEGPRRCEDGHDTHCDLGELLGTKHYTQYPVSRLMQQFITLGAEMYLQGASMNVPPDPSVLAVVRRMLGVLSLLREVVSGSRWTVRQRRSGGLTLDPGCRRSQLVHLDVGTGALILAEITASGVRWRGYSFWRAKDWRRKANYSVRIFITSQLRPSAPHKLTCMLPVDAASLDKDIEFILGFLRPLRPNIA
jgi:hypothetical protein